MRRADDSESSPQRNAPSITWQPRRRRARGYRFDAGKITYTRCNHQPVQVTHRQLNHEWAHLLGKVQKRDPDRWRANKGRRPKVHPCFRVVPGGVEDWASPST